MFKLTGNTENDIRKMYEHIGAMEENYNYALQHIGMDNIDKYSLLTYLGNNEQMQADLMHVLGSMNIIDGAINIDFNYTKEELENLDNAITSLNITIGEHDTSISTFQQTASSLQSKITDIEGNVTVVTQTISGLTIAINNTKTIFDINGLTIKNGGFRIVNSYNVNMFLVDSSGNVTLAGDLYNTSNNKTVRLYNGTIQVGSGNSAGGNTSWWQNIVGTIYGEYYALSPLPSEESLILLANKSLYMRSTYYSSVGWGMGSAGHVFNGRVQLNNDIYMSTSRGMRSFAPTRLTDTPEGDFVLSATW